MSNRLGFDKDVVLSLILLLSCFARGEVKGKSVDIPMPTPAQLAWQEAELGVVFHYDLHVFDDKHYYQPRNRVERREDINIFNPTELDTDQWVRTAKEMGAKFAIITASHETGFRLWQSDANPYSLKSTKWGDGKRDIVGEFIASCRKYGLKPGVYMGTRWNGYLGVYDFKVTKRSTITQEAYNKMIEAEVEEICSRYGDLFELWFDGGAYGPKDGGPDVLSVFEKYQPNCLFYHNYQRADARWGGSESGTVPYPCWARLPFADGYEGHKKESHASGFRMLKFGVEDGQYWCPAMSDAPLRNHEWFWDEGDERKISPLNRLVNMYYASVGRNSTLIVGLTPDNRGLMPDADVQRCREFGQAIRDVLSNQVAATSGKGNTLELKLAANSAFDHLVIQEDIKQGERVRQFKVEVLNDGQWTEINTGSCIGHKRIVKFKAPVTAEKLRLTITEAIAEPIIKTFAIYDSTNTKDVSDATLDFTRLIQPVPEHSRLEQKDWFVWGASVLQGDDDKYHMFYCRWPKKYPFTDGWVLDAEICYAVADEPTGPFRHVRTVLRGRKHDGEVQAWDGASVYNPHVKKFGDKVYLYYSAGHDPYSTGVIGNRNNTVSHQCTGVVIADSIEDLANGRFQRFNEPILKPLSRYGNLVRKDEEYGDRDNITPANIVIVNPSVEQRPDGKFIMIFKGWRDKKGFGPVHGVAIADSPIGSFEVQPDPVLEIPLGNGRFAWAEDPFLWYDKNTSLFLALVKDFHGHITNAGHSLALFESKDGLQWHPALKALASSRRILWENGSTQVLDRFERPQLLFDKQGCPMVLYCACAFQNRSFNIHIPLKTDM